MQNFLRSFALACVVAALSSGCTARRIYNLPAAPRDAVAYIPQLLDAAKSFGHEAIASSQMLVITFDSATKLYFNVDDDYVFRLHVVVSEGDVPEPERKARLDLAKKRADEIWQKAITDRGGPPPSQTPMYSTID